MNYEEFKKYVDKMNESISNKNILDTLEETIIKMKNEHLIRTIAIDNVHKGIVKIGHYKTKERVIEVLDEIQDLLQNAYAGNGNRIVYQMPEN